MGSLSKFVILSAFAGCLVACQNKPGVVPRAAPGQPQQATNSDYPTLAGVPAYPGATISANVSSGDPKTEMHFSRLLTTSDSVEKVAQFYKDNLKFESMPKNGVYQLIGRTPQGADVIIFVGPESGSTKVTIKGILYPPKK